MAFWSGEKLAVRLPSLISPFLQTKIDCAAYTLAVGDEVFVTEDKPDVGGLKDGVKQKLGTGSQIRIPPGQFAFLVTEEIIKVPNDALAFISMKAKYKFKGLVNVSGFHVDPGWDGQLVFSVYNAGPAPVYLERGLPLFLIWYSDLDASTTMGKKMTAPQMGLSNDLMSNMSGQVFSPVSLGNQLKYFREDYFRLRSDFDSHKTLVYSLGSILLTITIGASSLLFAPFRDFIEARFENNKSGHTENSRPKDSSRGTSELPSSSSHATRGSAVQIPTEEPSSPGSALTSPTERSASNAKKKPSEAPSSVRK